MTAGGDVRPLRVSSLERVSMTTIAKVQKALDTINEACRQNPDNSRLRERQLHLQGLLEALAG